MTAGRLVASVLGGGHVLFIVARVLFAARIAMGAVRRRGQTSEPEDQDRVGTTSARPAPTLGTGPVSAPSPPAADGRAEATAEVLVVHDLAVAYGAKRAVDGLSFEIGRAQIFGLLGPNGAGKTTTLSAIEGLITPQAGRVVVDGIDVVRHPVEARAKLGVQLQATSFQDELTTDPLRRPGTGQRHRTSSVVLRLGLRTEVPPSTAVRSRLRQARR